MENTIHQFPDPKNDSIFEYRESAASPILARMIFTDQPGQSIEEAPIKIFIGNDEQDITFHDWEDAEAYIMRALTP